MDAYEIADKLEHVDRELVNLKAEVNDAVITLRRILGFPPDSTIDLTGLVFEVEQHQGAFVTLGRELYPHRDGISGGLGDYPSAVVEAVREQIDALQALSSMLRLDIPSGKYSADLDAIVAAVRHAQRASEAIR